MSIINKNIFIRIIEFIKINYNSKLIYKINIIKIKNINAIINIIKCEILYIFPTD